MVCGICCQEQQSELATENQRIKGRVLVLSDPTKLKLTVAESFGIKQPLSKSHELSFASPGIVTAATFSLPFCWVLHTDRKSCQKPCLYFCRRCIGGGHRKVWTGLSMHGVSHERVTFTIALRSLANIAFLSQMSSPESFFTRFLQVLNRVKLIQLTDNLPSGWDCFAWTSWTKTARRIGSVWMAPKSKIHCKNGRLWSRCVRLDCREVHWNWTPQSWGKQSKTVTVTKVIWALPPPVRQHEAHTQVPGEPGGAEWSLRLWNVVTCEMSIANLRFAEFAACQFLLPLAVKEHSAAR